MTGATGDGRYTLRRPLRGHAAATLDLTWPQGSALAYAEPCPWLFVKFSGADDPAAVRRLSLCSLSSVSGALIGTAGASWPASAEALRRKCWLPADAVGRVGLVWWFGRLIASSDMHEGNLSFHSDAGALRLAPVYDMLPMRYAPERGGETPPQIYAPPLPLPSETELWHRAAHAAVVYWQRCSDDGRISVGFRILCKENAATLKRWVG